MKELERRDGVLGRKLQSIMYLRIVRWYIVYEMYVHMYKYTYRSSLEARRVRELENNSNNHKATNGMARRRAL